MNDQIALPTPATQPAPVAASAPEALLVRSSPHYPIGFFGPISCLLRSAGLAWELSKREVQGRYRGSAFGILWATFNPLLMLAVFTFVFGFVFQARWDRDVGNRTEFAIILFAGLMLYWPFAECLSRAPELVRGNVNYVKKVAFPLEILPWTVVAGALFHLAISVAVLLLASWAALGTPPWTGVLFPLVLVPFVLLTLGLTWIMASLGVYLPDIGQVLGVGLLALMFLSPIFYPSSALPEAFASLFYLNPLTLIVEETRRVFIFGELPLWRPLGIYFAVSWAVAWVGFAFFQKTRRGFADVL